MAMEYSIGREFPGTLGATGISGDGYHMDTS